MASNKRELFDRLTSIAAARRSAAQERAEHGDHESARMLRADAAAIIEARDKLYPQGQPNWNERVAS